MKPIALDQIPPELLESIAFYVATDELLGPPAYLVPLLLTNRKIHAALSSRTNHHLYAAIYASKFDVGLARKRLGDAALTPAVLAAELKRRMTLFQHIQSMTGSTDASSGWDLVEGEDIDAIGDDVLLTAYLMMLENQGKNEAQLRHHAHLPSWLKYFWFHERGRSGALSLVRQETWPVNGPQTAIAMWLFWFFLKPDEYASNNDAVESPLSILKIQAHGAHKYPLSEVPWPDYEYPEESRIPMKPVMWYSQVMDFVPPPLAIPAILSYFALTNRRRPIPLTPGAIQDDLPLDEWSKEWTRALPSGSPSDITRCFLPGSLDGIWEGYFTYVEYTTYAVLLRGAPPQTLQKSVVCRHQQTWKLREYFLFDTIGEDGSGPAPRLSPGDPLQSFLPSNCKIKEHRDRVVLEEPGQLGPMQYMKSDTVPPEQRSRVLDILVVGEGHSSWGQFSLIGRVRPCDGFISLVKNYVDGERGRWLYRGYLAGNTYGNLVGRWRETFTSHTIAGYEGCFALSRRR